MNAVDLLIVLFAILSVARGFRIGLARQAGSTLGFIAGLFVGSWASSIFISYESNPTTKFLTGLVTVLCCGFIVMTIGEVIGIRLKERLMRISALNAFDGSLGSAMSVTTVLFTVWLSASLLLISPNTSLQQPLNNSHILGALNSHLPPATSVLSSLNKLINPNDFPEVFRGLEPSPDGATNVPSLAIFNPVIAATSASVVKVEGTGCGGIVEGSGFVVQPNEIVTNAHVIAGVTKPKVIDGNTVHSGRVIWFDPDVDLAVLHVDNLSGKPLVINATDEPFNTPGVVLGYPGGGGFTAQAAAIIDHFPASGRNIYGQGNTTRDIYSVHAHIIPGNSGGPLIGRDGRVLGIVFATSTTYNNVGYALTGHQVSSELATAEQSTTIHSTGSCSE
ncbi:MAG TPA: MarP family serine protease [Candidatus Saccharimonadia bacterium]|nr:MarP family serine protease [Candidatus Saccharimonadia bacterium]